MIMSLAEYAFGRIVGIYRRNTMKTHEQMEKDAAEYAESLKFEKYIDKKMAKKLPVVEKVNYWWQYVPSLGRAVKVYNR